MQRSWNFIRRCTIKYSSSNVVLTRWMLRTLWM